MRTGPVELAVVVRGRFRASDADREQVIEDLKVAFVQGRLTKDELDERAGQAFASRTYADLAVAIADIPAIRPRPGMARPHAPGPAKTHARAMARTQARTTARARARARAQARARARKAARRRANPRMLTWSLGLATIALPALITAALVTGSQDLFSATIVPIIAYVLAAVVAANNVIAARLENDSGDESGRQLTSR